ncbi:MAG: response regulator [Cyanobacteriota bacterium]|nr:response regulator [Cyanobacteriota bacterium]
MISQPNQPHWIQFLSARFEALSRMQFSGRMDLTTQRGASWVFYFYQGKLAWGSGGRHAVRRWRRLMSQFCPQVDLETLTVRGSDQGIPCLDYHALHVLLKRHVITYEQMLIMVDHTITEILFDIFQSSEDCSYVCDAQTMAESPSALLALEQVWPKAKQNWDWWHQAGLADYSPLSAPVLRRQLKDQVSRQVYETMVAVMDGRRSLKDLALLMRQDLLNLTRSLLPYIQQQSIDLVDIPDFEPLAFAAAPPQVKGALVACIDDSPLVGQTMQQILTHAGYRFVGIQDSAMALTTLLEQKPDFIFLDLVMPVANGYEICAQIRRMSAFKNTPIVILTGNDGLVDRMRAKMVGSTDFMAKPIESAQVLAVLQKYLPSQVRVLDSTAPLIPNQENRQSMSVMGLQYKQAV